MMREMPEQRPGQLRRPNVSPSLAICWGTPTFVHQKNITTELKE
jgi:hypothetical protein